MHILITGIAGFIGFHLSKRLMHEGINVTGIDNINDYYDPDLKYARLSELKKICRETGATYNFQKIDLSDNKSIQRLFKENKFNIVINLAAQAGVRNSINNPHSYRDSNINGFLNILEACRFHKPDHLIFASSSSVYGMNTKIPFATTDNTDYPISLYAASKKSNELMAHAYAHLFKVPITGLRFFTVYGPFGRPDMAYFKFTKAILEGHKIDVFNNGKMQRDFTYIDDIVEGILLLLPKPPSPLPSSVTKSMAPFKIYNIGNNNPVKLSRFIKAIEKSTGLKALKNNMPMQAGDVPITYADVDDLIFDVGFKPETSIEDGIEKFVNWYLKFFKTPNKT
jgi:UDP-glucuronate 4-epimerase